MVPWLWIIELSLIQLFKTEQILPKSVCLSLCLPVCPRTRQCIGSIEKLAQPQQQQQQQHWLDRVSAAAVAAVWWWEIPASHCRMVQTAACCIVCRFLCVSPVSLPVYGLTMHRPIPRRTTHWPWFTRNHNRRLQ